MTMVKTIAVFILLAISLAGAAYGAFHHSRFIKAGGQRGFIVVQPAAQTDAMRGPYRRMLRGYGTFIAAGGIMGFIAAVWGPVVI